MKINFDTDWWDENNLPKLAEDPKLPLGLSVYPFSPSRKHEIIVDNRGKETVLYFEGINQGGEALWTREFESAYKWETPVTNKMTAYALNNCDTLWRGYKIGCYSIANPYGITNSPCCIKNESMYLSDMYFSTLNSRWVSKWVEEDMEMMLSYAIKFKTAAAARVALFHLAKQKGFV